MDQASPANQSSLKSWHIACAADDRFAVLAATMLKSVELQVPDGTLGEVWFLNSGISRSRRKMIQESLNPEKVRVHFLSPTPENFGSLSAIPEGRKYATYHRLLIPQLVPGRVERLLYLDADILVKKPLDELFATRLEEHEIIAAARDSIVWTVGCEWGGGIQNWEALGMEKDARYFNAGMLLIDVKKWNAANVTARVCSCIAEHRAFVKWHDQYGLNVILHTNWNEVPAKWNAVPGKPDAPGAHILHFVDRKPHELDYKGDYSAEFFSVLDQTAWRGRRSSKMVIPHWVPRRLRGRLKWMLSPW